MRILNLTVIIALTLMACRHSAMAQTSYPMVMSLTPVAAQLGQSTEHTVESRYSMFGAYQVLVTGTGVTGEVVTKMEPGKDGKEPSLTKIKVRFTVDQNALPGVRDFRIVGPTGASTLGQLVVVRDAVVNEDPKNDTAQQAQNIPIPVTVCGTVEKSEDVDFYRFQVSEPTTLTFHCQAMRLEDKIHDLQTHVDPILTIRNARTNSTVAAVDNTFAADPLLTHQFPAGEYLLEVRDVRYSGNRYWNYSIEISSRPFVSNVHPTGVTSGHAAQLELVGSNLPEARTVSWNAPSDANVGCLEVALPLADDLSNPVPLVVTDLPVVLETTEPNDAAQTAQQLEIPCAVSGRVSSEADIDCFAFEAKKGDRLSFEVKARRNWSGLDSIIRIVNSDGKQLTENDDLRLWNKMTLQDSQIENWTAPADGRYVIEVRDVHLRGGDEYVYLLEATRAEPYFELVMDSDKSWLTPGTSAALFVRVVRKNGFDGEVQLAVDGLPQGVTAECGCILAGKGVDGCIILTAAADAPMTAANITVAGTSTLNSAAADGNADAEAIVSDKPVVLTAVARPMQETYMPGGGRSHWPVSMHTVAVGKAADVMAVKLSTHDVSLKPGESAKVDVEVVRGSGYDKNITLDMLYQHLSSKYANTLPEGVSIDLKKSKTLLTGTNTQGAITLTAAANAPAVERQQCCVMANVSINFVMKATYSSQPLMISVIP